MYMLSLPLAYIRSGSAHRCRTGWHQKANLAVRRIHTPTISKKKTKKQKNLQKIFWSLITLNTYGSSFGNPGRVGGGGVIRDFNGLWLKGFSVHLGQLPRT